MCLHRWPVGLKRPSALGSAKSVEAYVIAFEFKIPPISTITVCSTSFEALWLPTATLRATLMDRIFLSHTRLVGWSGTVDQLEVVYQVWTHVWKCSFQRLVSCFEICVAVWENFIGASSVCEPSEGHKKTVGAVKQFNMCTFWIVFPNSIPPPVQAMCWTALDLGCQMTQWISLHHKIWFP